MGFYSGACTNSIRSGLENRLDHKSLMENISGENTTNLSDQFHGKYLMENISGILDPIVEQWEYHKSSSWVGYPPGDGVFGAFYSAISLRNSSNS